MSLHVRAITSDELLGWVEVMNIAFHSNRAPEAVADYNRERLGGDFSRTLATFDGERVIGTYESFTTDLSLPGGTCVPSNAVTAVSVLPTHHRRGALTRMITQDLGAARERGEAASVLIAAEYPIYGRFGFGPAVEEAEYTLHKSQARFIGEPPPGSVDLVEPRALREIAPKIFDRFQREHPGQIGREPFNWDTRLGLRTTPWRPPDQVRRCALYSSASGEPEGYALYAPSPHRDRDAPGATLEVHELASVSDAAYLSLWRYLVGIDLVAEVTAEMRRVDEPLAWQLVDARKALRQTARSDFLWLRPLDVPRLLEARRYACEARVVFEVDDPLGLTAGRFALEGGPEGARCQPTQATPDIRLSMPALGAISLGGVSLHVLQHAGRLEQDQPDGLTRAERLFHWPIAPWCSTFF